MADNQHLQSSFREFMSGKMTEPEKDRFFSQVSTMSQEELSELLKEDWLAMSNPGELPDRLYTAIMEQTAPHRDFPAFVHRVHFLKTAWFRAAAAVLIILTGFFLYNSFSHISQPGTEVTIDQSSPVSHDILPGYNRAVLTLSDGKQIELDSAASETITDQTLSILNNNGHLLYTNNDLLAINTMTTPKGGQYRLTLTDGTTVWLNAESSITFPTAFKGSRREVSVTGEVYFEVKKDAKKPFIVITPKEAIVVLGTEFNVNVYGDEPASKTSLIDGVIKINDQLLKPGQAYMNGKIMQTNISQDIAWKNGAFQFDGMNLETALRQISRWYDVQIVYEGAVPNKAIEGKMGRDLSLSQMQQALASVGVNTRLEGKKLIVLAK